MSYEEYCEFAGLTPNQEEKQIFDAGRRSVADEIAAMFGIAVSDNEEERFLSRIEGSLQ